MPMRRPFVGLAVAMALAVIASTASARGPYSCGPFTLSEDLTESTDFALAEWVAGDPPKDVFVERPGYRYLSENQSLGSTTFRIVRTRDGAKDFAVGDEIAYPRYVAGEKGDRFLLARYAAGDPPKGYWSSVGKLPNAGFDYIAGLPAADGPVENRVAYFVRFLEFDDPLVSADAFMEIERFSPDDLAKSADKLPRAKLREWVAEKDPRTDSRLELYGIMLGLCGDASDAELLRKRIVEGRPNAENPDVRPAINGVKTGYLLLAGERGLANLEREDLVDREAIFSETFSTYRAVRFMAEHGRGKIGKERLCESVRLLLDRSDIVDFAISDLAWWKDWSVRERIFALYDKQNFDIPPIQRAIIRYFLLCERDVPADAKTDPPHVADAKRRLAELRRRDPKLVSDVERFTFFE
ncbi:MAG: hypothetical protein WD066_05045 [Planctomycetaceae bacterium]